MNGAQGAHIERRGRACRDVAAALIARAGAEPSCTAPISPMRQLLPRLKDPNCSIAKG